MIFSFLKYIRPVWYFNIKPTKDHCYFPSAHHIQQQGFTLSVDYNFNSAEAKKRDMAWRAFQKGFISSESGNGLPIWDDVKLPIQDNYLFLRKNFSKVWVYYVLIIRLFTFKNPIPEISALLNTRKVKRENFSNNHFQYSNYQSFNSKLLQEQPLVSVVIPTLNRYNYLEKVLEDLEKQNYTNFEVIIVDQSNPFQKEFYKKYNLNLNVNTQEEKALWLARNSAIKMAKDNYILLLDDDSRLEPNWIESHLKCIDFFNADISSGVSISKVGGKVPEHYSYFRISDQLDTGNVLIKKSVFKNIGLFDRQFEKQRMGDGEFGMRAYKNGFLNVSNPIAKRLHLKVETGGLREMGSWDAFRNQKLFGPIPIPSVLYFFRNYFGNKNAKRALIKTVPFAVIPFQFKKNKPLQILGFCFSLLISPIIMYQVHKSWKLSGKKLNAGALIEELK